MLKIEEHRLFRRYLKKLSLKQMLLYRERIKMFSLNPRHPLLKLHRLHGILDGSYAFSIGGDLRVVFEWVDKNHILLLKIGTHNQVY